jgi:hypothetical protein
MRSPIQHSLRQIRVVCQPLRALDRLVDVRDDSPAPAAHLVAENPETVDPAASDGTFGNDAA